ncbi:MAG TPA: peptidase dimerization domain-containing protein [Deltaproteobacteria bacterium]|nr:peptidase dimerization domain-containing protein [Deltaproteobacteria bacterium]
MSKYLDSIPSFVETIKSMKETIITNIVLIGQTPAPTFKEKRRSKVFMERLAESQVDECTTDGYRNPLGIIHGASEKKPPIFVVAHLDTPFQIDMVNYRVGVNTIKGPGILDNSLGVGILLSMPEILRKLELRFESDIVLAGVIQSVGKGNLRGIRHLIKTWPTPIRGAVCVEGVELGRLNYYTEGMTRCEIKCDITASNGMGDYHKPNPILILNDVINQILKLRLPQRPRTRIVFGQIRGGISYGKTPQDATLGFEIRSDSDRMVKSVFNDIKDITDGIGHEHDVALKITTIANANAARLNFNHPLVKSAGAVMKTLGLKPVSDASESELSIFLSNKIPAVTLGITRGKNQFHLNSSMKINPMFKGIAQVVGVLMAIDSGICDE